MPTIDLGDPLPNLGIQVFNNNEALATAASVVLTLALPDGTNATPTVTTPTTGVYVASYTTVQAGRHAVRWVVTTIAGGAAQEVYVDTWDVDDTGTYSAIVGLDDIKAHLGITQPFTDDRLRSVALLASEMVEAYTGRVYRRQTITETYDGGSNTLILRRLPVQAITSVTVAGIAAVATDYTLDTLAGIVYRNTLNAGWAWPSGTLNITVVYTVAPAVIPFRARQATLELIRHLWDSQRGGYSIPKQQGAGDDWDPRQGYSIPRRVAELLDQLRGPGL